MMYFTLTKTFIVYACSITEFKLRRIHFVAVPEWYTLIKNWYIVRQARKHGREVKRRSTQFFSRTKDMATERTINAVDALHNTTDAIASRVKEATRKSSAGDDVANDETLRSSNETSPDRNMKASSSQPVRLLRLQSRSGGNSGVPMRNFGSMMSIPTSTRAVMGAIPKNAHDFHDEQEMENNMKWKLVSARVDDVARFWIPLAFIVSLSIISWGIERSHWLYFELMITLGAPMAYLGSAESKIISNF